MRNRSLSWYLHAARLHLFGYGLAEAQSHRVRKALPKRGRRGPTECVLSRLPVWKNGQCAEPPARKATIHPSSS